MESEYRRGYVYIQNHFAGIIAETEEGYIFSYDKEYLSREDAVAVSLTLPLRDEPYETTIFFPFFSCGRIFCYRFPTTQTSHIFSPLMHTSPMQSLHASNNNPNLSF